jgi:hypothetical protein
VASEDENGARTGECSYSGTGLTKLLNVNRKGVALYTQLASVLRNRILQEEWKQRDRLPSIPVLADADDRNA